MKAWLPSLVAALAIRASCAHSAPEETIQFSRFGTVTIYRSPAQPSRVALFVSGDGGWNLGVVDMARSLASEDTLVVGIDITRYLKSVGAASATCSYPAADFEALSHFVQKKLDLPHYLPPVLVGYSSGATLVYAVLVQAPSGTFRGAISMGFCADLPLTRPFCRGAGLAGKPGPRGKGISFLPAGGLETPWIAFQGTIDQVCDPASVQAFARQVGSAANVVLLPKVGHGFSVQRNWLPRLREAIARLTLPPQQESLPSSDVQDLPLIEVPATGSEGEVLAVLLSGDGGWAGLDKEVSASLAAEGVPVVGLDSLEYFWKERTPEEAARDLERLLRHYIHTWEKKRVILVGYSLGANVLPFMARGLSADVLAHVTRIVLLGPGKRAAFEFHVSDWLSGSKRGRPILPEVEALHGPEVLCVYGAEEEGSLCPGVDKQHVQVVAISGGHHFGGNYQEIARLVLGIPKKEAYPRTDFAPLALRSVVAQFLAAPSIRTASPFAVRMRRTLPGSAK